MIEITTNISILLLFVTFILYFLNINKIISYNICNYITLLMHTRKCNIIILLVNTAVT